ncbi:MAG: hypothetical protein Pars93KO_26630 [Parasphingorhabdus sp.]
MSNKTAFNLDEQSVKQAISDNLESILEVIEYTVMDIMQAHNAEFCTDEHNEQPNPHYPDKTLHKKAYYEACLQVASVAMAVIPNVVTEHNAPFILPVDSVRNAYLADCEGDNEQ